MGHSGRGDHRGPSKGTDPGYARHLGPSRAQRPPGDQEYLRVSALQDQDQRTHICLDFQPQNQGEARQVGAGGSGSAAQRVRGIQKLFYFNGRVHDVILGLLVMHIVSI